MSFQDKKKYSNWKRGQNYYWNLCKKYEISEEHNLNNPNIVWDMVKNIKKLPEYLWESISKNPNISKEIVESNPGFPWDVPALYENSSYYLSEDEISLICCSDQFAYYLSGRDNLSFDTVKKFPHVNWMWECISANPNITWETVRDNPDKPWKWHYLSENPNITWEMVRDNPDKNWSWIELSVNPNITWEIVRDNPEYPWNWDLVSENPNITLDIIEENMDREWSWSYFLTNPNITEEFIEKYREKFIVGLESFKYNILLFNNIVYKREKTFDLKWRKKNLKKLTEEISPFSRNIDSLIRKRINYL